MKGSAAPVPRRRWRGTVSKVMALVLLSLLVPLLLLVLQSRFPYGYQTDERSALRQDLALDGRGAFSGTSETGGSSSQQDLPVLETHSSITVSYTVPNRVEITGRNSSETTGIPKSEPARQGLHSHSSRIKGSSGGHVKSAADESGQPCQHEFGSYCLWSVEHKVEMDDTRVRKLKDQLFIARAYYPSIIKVKSEGKLSRAMRLNIQEHERILSEAMTDADLPPRVAKTIEKMEHTIARARSVNVDCTNVLKKLRQILDLAEDEVHFHKRQSAFLYHLGVHTMPKSIHCLSLRLTVEYFIRSSGNTKTLHRVEIENPSLQNYVIFSRNVLASSVVINSTVMNSKESGNQIFHVVTDRQNYFAMTFWFSENSYKDSVVRVINLEDFDTEDLYKLALDHHLPFNEEFRILFSSIDQPFLAQLSTEYISVFGLAQFILPVIFRNLKKVVVLDEDVVVQRDLSPLWGLDLDGKVIGAMHFCNVRLGQLKNYLGGNNYNKDSCIWMSGLNIIDLEQWREHNITTLYEMFLQTLRSESDTSRRAAALPASYLAFHDLTFPLDSSWVLSDLGTKYGLNPNQIQKAAVLHYNGNMKPWLDLGIRKYKKYWKKFLTRGNLFMEQCNVNL